MTIIVNDGAPQYVGATLSKNHEHNWYDDSDFYARAWNGHEIVEVITGSTRAHYTSTVTVDATPEVLAQVEAWYTLQAALARKAEALKPDVGKRVCVARGRKVPRGTVGVIERLHETYFTQHYRNGYAKPSVSALLRLDDGSTVWTNIKNVDVVEEEP